MSGEDLVEEYQDSISIPQKFKTDKEMENYLTQYIKNIAEDTMKNYSRVKIGYGIDDYVLIPKYFFKNKLDDKYNLVDENIELEKYDILEYLLRLNNNKSDQVEKIFDLLKIKKLSYNSVLINLNNNREMFNNFKLYSIVTKQVGILRLRKQTITISIPILKEIFILESDLFEYLLIELGNGDLTQLITKNRFDMGPFFYDDLDLYVTYTLLNELNQNDMDKLDKFIESFQKWASVYKNLKYIQLKWFIEHKK